MDPMGTQPHPPPRHTDRGLYPMSEHTSTQPQRGTPAWHDEQALCRIGSARAEAQAQQDASEQGDDPGAEAHRLAAQAQRRAAEAQARAARLACYRDEADTLAAMAEEAEADTAADLGATACEAWERYQAEADYAQTQDDAADEASAQADPDGA